MTENLEEIVRNKYGAMARSGLSSDRSDVRSVAEAFGYSSGELDAIPAGANMGLSCGNPTAFASLRPGEVVVDLGSGGGLDVFLAARAVGPTGRAIGIDMTADMIELARRNAASMSDDPLRGPVEFHLSTIDRLPLPDASVDCILSNCVINLAPNKQRVFAEMARVLKPGGRVAISDIALKQALPDDLSQNLLAYVGCIAGAIEIETYRAGLAAAGFSAVQIIDSGADLNAYALVDGQSACCAPTPTEPVQLALTAPPRPNAVAAEPGIHAELQELLTRYNVNDFAASVKVLAVRS